MTTQQQDNLVGTRFNLDVNIGGITALGTVTIIGNYEEICWGELRAGDIINYHTFYIKYGSNHKPEKVEVNPIERYTDRSGTPKPSGTRQEVEQLYSQLVESRIEAKRFKAMKQEQEALGKIRMEEFARKSQQIASKKKELKEQLAKLYEGLDMEEALKDKEILALTAKINAFNLIYLKS